MPSMPPEEERYKGIIQVLRPPYSLYEPFGWYPLDTTGGILQQASLWPWVAGIVDILAVVEGH